MMNNNNTNTNETSTINAAPVKIRTRKCVEPISKAEASELQSFLMGHGLCIKNAKKLIRVYRYLGHKNNKILTSRDFMYICHADEWRENKQKIFDDILSYSLKVMDNAEQVKHAEYVKNMEAVEEDLLINHGVRMVWDKSKTVRFLKFKHVIADREILKPLDEFAKHNTNFVTNRIYKTKDGKHLKIFQKMAQIFEETDPTIPFYDWHSFRYVTKNGQVVAAYSMVDMKDEIRTAFAKGIKDKFDYNLNIMNKDYINSIVAKFDAQHDAELAALENA